MFNWFKKKKVTKESKKTYKWDVEYKEETFDVGKTFIEITLASGEKLTRTFLGDISQMVYPHTNYCGNVYYYDISPVLITSSKEKARWYLDSLKAGPQTYYLEENNFDKIIVGELKLAEIKETIPFQTTFKKAYLKQIEIIN